MESWYPVFWNGKEAGEVAVVKQGLYYQFSCRVDLPPGSHCRLFAHTAAGSRDLGLCIPDGNRFILQTRIPVKHFSEGEYRFCLNQPVAGEFVAVSSQQPFSAMDRLEAGRFAMWGNEPGILFSTQNPSHTPSPD